VLIPHVLFLPTLPPCPQAMLATQGIIGVGTIAMANGVATSAIVKERSIS